MKAQFVCPIYPARIIVVQESKEKIDWRRKRFDHVFGPSPVPIKYGMCITSKDGYCGLFFTNEGAADEGCVVHEVVHCANWIFDHCGIRPDLQNDEPYAHLVGYLFTKVWSILNRFEKQKPKSRKAKK